MLTKFTMETTKDIKYYKGYRLVKSIDGYWYSESFSASFTTLKNAKEFIDELEKYK